MAAADTTAPVLTSLSFPSSVDVTTGGKSIAFSVGASDVGLGVNNVTLGFKTKWQGQYGTDNYVFLGEGYGDSFSDGISIASEFIDRTTGSGAYEIDFVAVADKAGNSRYYYTSELISLGFQTSFAVTSNAQADATAPILTSLSFPSSVDVTTGGKSVAFSVGASDAGLGVNNVTVSFKNTWQGQYGADNYVFLGEGYGDSFSDGVSTSSEFIDRTSGSGKYEVDFIAVADKAGNSRYYYTSELISLGFQTSFAITSTAQTDTTAPVLTSLSFPSSVDVTTGGKSVAFSAGASDAGLGVNNVTVAFKSKWQGQYGADNYVFFGDGYGDGFSDGVSTASEFIDRTSGSGNYEVDFVAVADKAGNSRYYYTSELVNLGFQTSFNIIDRTVGPTAVITSPNFVAEDGGDSFTLGVTLANVSQASGTVTMSFAAGQSTATNGLDVSVPTYSGSYSVVQSPAGNYTITLPSINVFKDQVVEGTETVAVTIKASGQIFDTGTDTTTVLIKLVDSGQTGSPSADTLTGTPFSDNLSGKDGNDILRGGAGNDQLDGGAGVDTAVFASLYHQAGLLRSTSDVRISSAEGVDTVTGVERFQFSDGVLQFESDAAYAQVQRAYDTVLGRAPDLQGLDFYVDQMEDRGVTLVAIASDLANSAEFQVVTGGFSNSQFVDYVYTHALSREADVGGKSYYTQALDQGMSRGAFVVDLSESAEHRGLTTDLVELGFFNTDDNYQAVALLYDSFSGRKPDAGGLGYYAERLKAGTLTLAQAANDFAGSTEFKQATSGLSNEKLVDYMYRNTLDREADAGGRAYYTNALDQGLSKGSLLLEFSQSQEHYNFLAGSIIGGIEIL